MAPPVLVLSIVANIKFFPLYGGSTSLAFLKLGFYNEQSVFLLLYRVNYECFQWCLALPTYLVC